MGEDGGVYNMDMTNTLFIVLFLAVPARSQPCTEDCVEQVVGAFSASPVRLSSPAATAPSLSSVYVAMNDAPGVAKDVYDFIASEPRLSVSFAYFGAPFVGGDAPTSMSAHHTDGFVEILISAAVPAEPQAVAPLLAREAGKLMLGDMPESAEKRYMLRSYEVRAWREMGGSVVGLPVIEAKTGYRDEKLAADFKLWLANDAQTAVDKIGADAGKKTLADQTAELTELMKTMPPVCQARTDAENELKRLAAADVTFAKFVVDETSWKAAHP